MQNKYLNIDWLKKNYKMIHYFGLGFIQLKLNDQERLHFYTDKLPKTADEEEIHNHRYNFVSTILKGTLIQEIYEVNIINGFTDKNTHWLTQETCQENNKKSFPTFPCDISLVFKQNYKYLQSYYIDHNTFHKVSSINAITHVKRSSYKKEYADIIFPVGQKPLCPFSVKRPEHELFEIVREML